MNATQESHVSIAAEIIISDHKAHYGGAAIMIDDRECSIGSVAGYARYYDEDPDQAVADCLEKMKKSPYAGHCLVWIRLRATVISSSPGFYERQVAARALMPKLKTGDCIKFEGKIYEIVGAPNRNYDLRPIL